MDETQKKKLKDAPSYQTVKTVLADLDLRELSVSEVHLVDRRLNELAPTPDVRIAFLGNCTVDPLATHLRVQAAFEGLAIGTYIGKYDQYYQEISSGELRAFDPELIHLSL